MAKTDAVIETIEIPPLNLQRFQLRITGETPLLVHKWSDKAKREMLDAQMKRATGAKKAKNPQEDYENSMHRMSDGEIGVPVMWFKNAGVGECRFIPNITMVAAKQLFYVEGIDRNDDGEELVKLDGEPEMNEAMVRVGMGKADIRYRAMFRKWACTITILHDADLITAEQIVNLLSRAGFHGGVGERRGQKEGNSFGRFSVDIVTEG